LKFQELIWDVWEEKNWVYQKNEQESMPTVKKWFGKIGKYNRFPFCYNENQLNLERK